MTVHVCGALGFPREMETFQNCSQTVFKRLYKKKTGTRCGHWDRGDWVTIVIFSPKALRCPAVLVTERRRSHACVRGNLYYWMMCRFIILGVEDARASQVVYLCMQKCRKSTAWVELTMPLDRRLPAFGILFLVFKMCVQGNQLSYFGINFLYSSAFLE